ncbi:acyl-CoA thioesterase [Shimia biformata]|uniref:acyl-CoA thioesterase n=1 Tax=Shimia biformata TaxID=1294299 RepID=UPI0019507AE6|nr:thioesterase family protein [Shimia biformata]
MDLPYHKPLTQQHLRGFGIEEPWPFGIGGRVMFSELDPLNHVNNRSYLAWFENVRIAYFADYGLDDTQGPNPRWVLRATSVDYRKELKLHTDYVVTARTTRLGRTSFTMDHAVWSAGGLATFATATIVAVAADGSGAEPLTEATRQVLIARDGAGTV